jgi:thiol-disulfide isomerase/thioredoxin
MRKLFQILILIAVAQSVFAQSAEVSKDGSGNKILKGFISRQELATDASFPWFAQNGKGYTPPAAAVAAFKGAKDSIYILAFGGTWCDDTKFILPKFYALTDAAAFPQDHITLLGVDESKKTIQHLSEAFNVTLVPTFIVLKNGQEMGRVVEYGKAGMWDKELGEVISGPSPTLSGGKGSGQSNF